MSKKPPRLKIGPNGEIKLPEEAMHALDLGPGEMVELRVDTRRKQIRLERWVDDPWGEAMKPKDERGFEDLMAEQKAREEEANKLFDKRSKEKPPERKPEDDPDHWR